MAMTQSAKTRVALARIMMDGDPANAIVPPLQLTRTVRPVSTSQDVPSSVKYLHSTQSCITEYHCNSVPIKH